MSSLATLDVEFSQQLLALVASVDEKQLQRELEALCLTALQSTDGHLTLFTIPGNEKEMLNVTDPSIVSDASEFLLTACPIAEDARNKAISCPVTAEGHWLGLLTIAGNQNGYGLSECRLLGALAQVVGQAIVSHQAFDHERHALAQVVDQVEYQQRILDNIHDSVISMDLEGYITSWNKGAERLFDYTAEEAINRNILILYADETEADSLLYNDFLENGGREMRVRRRKKNGEVFWASLTLSVLHDKDGAPDKLIGYMMDISERLDAEEKIRLHAKIFEFNSEAVVIMDAERCIVSVNKAFTDLTDYTYAEVVGLIPSFMRSEVNGQNFCQEMLETIQATGRWFGELWDRRKSGDVYPILLSFTAVRNVNAKVTHYLALFSDISQRRAAESQIHRLAYYDTLTDLPNRSSLLETLEKVLAEARYNKTFGALLSLNIHRFSEINDSFGYAIADQALVEVGRRIKERLRADDVVSRIGGDHFTIALFDICKHEHAAMVAQKLLDVIAEPFYQKDQEIFLSACIGIAVYPEGGFDGDALITHAEVAMQKAKQLNSHSFLFYSNEMNRHSLERIRLEAELKHAIERKEFCMYYQPQVDMRSGKIVGAEALIRWRKADGTIVMPGEFINFAEETGLILAIGDGVIEEVCNQIRQWIDADVPVVPIALNLSPSQFHNGLSQKISDYIEIANIPHHLVKVEITESILMQNDEAITRIVEQIHDMGIGMSLDDFGTGYSNLAYLKRFPIEMLKIDQSFVQGIPDSVNDVAITSSIISIAKNLGMAVLAEGVETKEQLAFLMEQGCHTIQGYYFSKPRPAIEFERMLGMSEAANFRGN